MANWYKNVLISVFGNWYHKTFKVMIPLLFVSWIIALVSTSYIWISGIVIFTLLYMHLIYRNEYRWRNHEKDDSKMHNILNNVSDVDTEKMIKENND